MTGWEEIDEAWRAWFEHRETVARVCAELRTERHVRPSLGCIDRMRSRDTVGRYVLTPRRRRRGARRF